jgi:Arc/MetJ-type ribon-helix-helix transcriptional regulator
MGRDGLSNKENRIYNRHMNTVNITISKTMYEDAKKALSKKGYASMSELVRDSLRKVLYPHLTVNGFTQEFEEEVLRAKAEPMDDAIVWETEADIDKYFTNYKKELRQHKNNDKS